jgi:hypothetical protein
VDSLEVADALVRKGYNRLVIQKGNGAHLPTLLVPDGQRAKLPCGLEVE